jgi:uncharacterized protein
MLQRVLWRSGGMEDCGATRPGAQPCWIGYLHVADVDASVKAIVADGGKVMLDMHEVPGGNWIAVAADPAGAVFGVVGPKGD